MHLLTLLDNRTLAACILLLASVFAIVFLVMRQLFPGVPGVRSIAISFLLAVPGILLLVSQKTIFYFAPQMVANFFIFASFIYLYRGILRLIGSSRRMSLMPWIASAVSMAVLFFFTQVHENVVPAVMAISVNIALIRGLIALELFRKSRSFTNPTMMRLFALAMSFFAALSLNSGVMAMTHGGALGTLQNNLAQTSNLAISVVSLVLTGLFLLLLSTLDLVAQSQDESQKDPLSGALNRRGIEAKLISELKHVRRGNKKLSIGLIDVDYFKSINDIQGHAAGDLVLCGVSKAITACLRGRDSLGRIGGDEFLVILPQASIKDAQEVAERLGKTVGDLAIPGRREPVTLSIGIAEAERGDDLATFLARADKGVYQAKSDGRNCCRVGRPEVEVPKDQNSNFASVTRIPATIVESSLIR